MPASKGEMGELQIAVMKILWQRGSATVHEVLGDMTKDPPPAYTTVLTVLRNLEKRELVQHDEIVNSRMYRYRPTVSADDLTTSTLTHIIDTLFDGSACSMLLYLLDKVPYSEAEFREIDRRLAIRKQASTAKNALS